MKKMNKLSVTLPLTVGEAQDIHEGDFDWTIEKLTALLPPAPVEPEIGMSYHHSDDASHSYKIVAVGDTEIVVERQNPSCFGAAGERLVQEIECFDRRLTFGQITIDTPQDAT